MKIVDLSKTIRFNVDDPKFMQVRIRHKPHRKARWLLRLFGLPFRLFPRGFEGWADEEDGAIKLLKKEKITLPGALASVSRFELVAAQRHDQLSEF